MTSAESVVEGSSPEAWVDLSRYPITELQAPEGRALVARGRESLARDGAFLLEGFLKADAVVLARGELAGLWSEAYYPVQRHNPYLIANDPALPTVTRATANRFPTRAALPTTRSRPVRC